MQLRDSSLRFGMNKQPIAPLYILIQSCHFDGAKRREISNLILFLFILDKRTPSEVCRQTSRPSLKKRDNLIYLLAEVIRRRRRNGTVEKHNLSSFVLREKARTVCRAGRYISLITPYRTSSGAP